MMREATFLVQAFNNSKSGYLKAKSGRYGLRLLAPHLLLRMVGGVKADQCRRNKVSTYMQGSFVEKGGWATSPGSDEANSAVAQACATMLGNLK